MVRIHSSIYLLCDLFQLVEEIGKLEDKVECANNALKADWERWKQNMHNDIRSAFTDMAEESIHYYEQVISGMRYCFTSKKLPSLFLLSVLCWESLLRNQVSHTKASVGPSASEVAS